MNKVYIVDACRTAIGKYAGTLSTVRPDDLLATAIKALLQRVGEFDYSLIEDVVAGAANQSGEDNRDVARMALLLAGLPTSIGGVTVNRLCASGLQAIVDSYRAIALGDAEIMIACGVESMSRAPFVMPKATSAFSRNAEIYDTTIGWRFTNPKLSALYHPYSMGETAENVAKQFNISRLSQDEFAFHSQSKYLKAHENNRFANEIIEVQIEKGKGKIEIFNKDEHPRLSTVEELSKLKPAFAKEGSVTAGNSSGVNDGSAALLLCNEKTLKKYGWEPLAVIESASVAGVDPSIMGIGPVAAINKLMQKTNLKLDQIDLVELNEAFAAQSLACIQELKLNPDKVNVNGGAIALGHPLGCSGARITTTLVHEMKKQNAQYGVASLCIGVGQGLAMLVSRNF